MAVIRKDDLLTIPRAADWIGVKRQSMFKIVKRRLGGVQRLDAYGNPIWMVRREDLDKYVLTRMKSDNPLPPDYVSSLAPHEEAQVLESHERGKQTGAYSRRRQ